MANRSIAMQMAREILRLYFGLQLKKRQIGRACGVAPSTVVNYVQRAREAGLSWPLPGDLDDTALEALLNESKKNPKSARRPQPDMEAITVSSARMASRCSFCGLNIRRDSQRDINTRSFVNTITNGPRT